MLRTFFFFFFESKQLESQCQTEKRVQQSQKEKLKTQYKLNTIFLNSMLRYETPPSALHTAQAHELPIVISFHMLDFPATKRKKANYKSPDKHGQDSHLFQLR